MTGRSMLWVRTVCSLCLMLGLAYPGAVQSASPKKTNKVEVAKSKPSRVKAVVSRDRGQAFQQDGESIRIGIVTCAQSGG